MARIAPFRGLRYNPDKVEHLEDVVTPPYDVIDAKAQNALLAKNPYNMIQLDLTKHAGETPSEERYANARRRFERWQEEEILIRDQEPGIYLYHIDYTLPNGGTYTRKGLVTLVQLAEFEEGVVKPHEKTFRSVTDDRLRLMDTCQAQFSQVFSLYPDDKGEIMAALESACPEESISEVLDQDGCRHALWAVTDPDVLARVRELFVDRSLYIADGHHRYTTALQLRELMRKREGEVAGTSPYNHIMMYLCPMEDAGLSVLPTHRLLYHPGLIVVDDLLARMEDHFDLEEIGGGSRETLIEQVLARMDENRGAGRTVFGMYEPDSDRCFLMTLKPGVMAREVGEELPSALQELDVVVLSDLIVKRLLGLGGNGGDHEGMIYYFSDPDEALDAAVKESAAGSGEKSPILFLMNHTPVAQVKRIADEVLVMPHKSTYFYPKILTGLIINKLVAGETIG